VINNKGIIIYCWFLNDDSIQEEALLLVCSQEVRNNIPIRNSSRAFLDCVEDVEASFKLIIDI